MNANKFLPPPIRLSQAFEPGKFSGGASGAEITRRSFMKRTGGATVATLVAWNLALKDARAENANGDSSPTSCPHLNWVIVDKRIIWISGKKHCLPIWQCTAPGCTTQFTLPDDQVSLTQPCVCDPGLPQYGTCLHTSAWQV